MAKGCATGIRIPPNRVVAVALPPEISHSIYQFLFLKKKLGF